MPTPIPSPHFSLRLKGRHYFKVLAFSGREAIGQPYRFDLELISERPDLDLQPLLQQPAFLAFGPDGTGVHGLVNHIAQGETGMRLTRYTLALVPQLSYLAHRTNSRIFQQRTVPEILAQLLEEHGIQADAYRFQCGPSVYPAREYCVQYAETDLHFLQRLCEEEGLHYHFQHSKDGHVLVFGDDQTVFPKLSRPTPYLPDSGAVTSTPAVKHFGARLATRPNQVSLRAYDFEQPHLQLESTTQAATPALEDYAYPARFHDRSHGKHLARRALERHRHDQHLAEGHSDEPLLRAGQFLNLGKHPRRDWNQLWLLGEVVHEGKQPQVLEELAGDSAPAADGFSQGYRNRFSATPWEQVFRLPLQHAKPRLLGSQSAVVTGPEGEEIHCDAYGRVKVQFHWDRDGQGDDTSSGWLRVASGWAGDRYGAIAIPRVGMEVLVSFLEGDPDQPLVTGCLYHKTHPAPYALPEHKTRSLFKTLSSPGGGGGNELRIEDRKDAEQIYLHAQRDWEQHVNHDHTLQVGHQRHETIEANSYSELKAEEHRITHGNRLAEIKADDHLTVNGSQHVKLGTGRFVEAAQEIHLSSGQKIVLETGSELTLKVGGSFVKLDASGVTLVGAQVKLNSGGSPSEGSGLKILAPVMPQAADKGETGNLLERAQALAAPLLERAGWLAAPLLAQAEALTASLLAQGHKTSREYRFNIRLQDVPGEEGFPFAHTPWRLFLRDEDNVLMQGKTDDQGRIQLDDAQQKTLSKAYSLAPQNVWLAYPGQRVGLRLHLERQDWDSQRYALAAMDFSSCVGRNQTASLEQERAKQDSRCSGKLFTHLQSKE